MKKLTKRDQAHDLLNAWIDDQLPLSDMPDSESYIQLGILKTMMVKAREESRKQRSESLADTVLVNGKRYRKSDIDSLEEVK